MLVLLLGCTKIDLVSPQVIDWGEYFYDDMPENVIKEQTLCFETMEKNKYL